MLRKVLVANRGEIALRIVRACHDLNIQAVVAYSEIDQETLAVRLADESICIGPAAADQSYLNRGALISAARITGCDAIHPGYGFLAEDADFVQLCSQHKLTFIGPQPNVIRTMSSKAQGRQAMQAAGIPVLPGSAQAMTSFDQIQDLARQIGYPLIIKPDSGGGGRSIYTVADEQELSRVYHIARAEAEVAFGHSGVLVEKYLSHTRHIEVQMIADRYGNAIHLGERDCSVQRRHQKLVEESPSLVVTPELRARLCAASLAGIEALGYDGVGTMEFLLDPEGNFYFIEMNTRIQVEHPVTEMLTGVDLVKWQLLLAGGERLSLTQQDIAPQGHVIECRINAEDPDRDFLPGSGVIELFVPPGGPGVRVDTHIFSGYCHPRAYDSLLAKIITWGQHRTEALDRMHRALNECRILGVQTTIPFQLAMLHDPDFRSGNISTRYVARMIDRWKSAA